MRILLMPRIEETHGSGSLTIVPMQFIQNSLENHPDDHFVVVVGKRFAKRDWLKRYLSLPDHLMERVELLPCVQSSAGARKFGYHAGHGIADHLRRNDILADVVVSNCFPSNPIIRSLMEWRIKSSPVIRVPMVSWSLWTGTNMIAKMGETAYNGKYDVIAEFFGAVCGDAIVFESILSEKGHLEMFREYFSPGAVRVLVQNSMVANLGVMTDKLGGDRVPRAGRLPVVMWSGFYRVTGKDCIPAMEKAYQMGLFDKAIINHMCSSLPEDVEERLRSYGWEIFARVPHDEYLNALKRADVFVSTNWAGAYGSRFAEMLSAGVVGVIHEDIRVNMVPSWYPYVCTKKNVAKMLIRALREHDSHDELSDRVMAHMREHHDTRRNFLRMYDFVKKIADDGRSKTKGGWLHKAAEDGLSGVDEVGHKEACSLMSETTRSKMDLYSNPMISSGAVRWAILSAGFVDVGARSPHYVRDKSGSG